MQSIVSYRLLFLQGILDKHTVCKSYNHKVKLVPNQKKSVSIVQCWTFSCQNVLR